MTGFDSAAAMLIALLAASAPQSVSSQGASPPAAAAKGAASELPDARQCIARARSVVGGKTAVDPASGASAFAEIHRCSVDLLDADKDAEALAVAKAGNELFPDEPGSGFDYGAILIQTGGDVATARTVIEQALKRTGRFTKPSESDRAGALGNLGRLALARGDSAAARAQFAEAHRLDPANTENLYGLAASEQRLGDAPACLNHIDEALKADPQGAGRDDFLVAAWAKNHTGKPVEASALLRRAIAALPNASGLHLSLGYSLATDGRPVDALLEYWYEFENDSADDPYAKEARLQFQDALGRTQAYPKYATTLLAIKSAVEDSADDPSAVLEDLQKVEAAGYHHVTLDLLRGETLYVKHDANGAEEIFRKILAADPAFLPAYLDLAAILRSSDRETESRRLVAEVARRNPSHWQLIGQPAPLPKP